MEIYHPPQEILDKYADIFVNYALNDGEGLKPGETVHVQIPESARPLYDPLYRKIILAGGNAIMHLGVQGNRRFFFENAKPEQISFFAENYLKGIIDERDHLIQILSNQNPQELDGIDPSLMEAQARAHTDMVKWSKDKEANGEFFWTLGLYGTPAMAKEANLSQKEYWDQIIHACFLDKEDPISEWKGFRKQVTEYQDKLNNMDIESIRIQSEGTDLTVGMGDMRKWIGGSAHNIPSFELFTSPDWRLTRGHYTFSEPLFYNGVRIEEGYLEFNDQGLVEKVRAKKGEDVLAKMLETPHANRLGEVSLTDKRFSRITKFMAHTLFDENVGGPYGNTHIAIGRSIFQCYKGDQKDLTEKKREELGYNFSMRHTDMVSTNDRIVTAKLGNGTEKVIYENGMFTL